MYGPGAAGIFALFRPQRCRSLWLYERDVNEFFVIQPLADGMWQKGNAQLGTHISVSIIPILPLADDSGMSHDFLIKRLDERIEGERFGIIDQWLVLYLFQCCELSFWQGDAPARGRLPDALH